MTRRDALLALGLLGLGTGMMGACGGTGLLIFSQQRKRTPVPASPTAEPTKTMTPQPGPQIVAREAWGALAPDHSARNEGGFYSATNPGGWRVYDQPLPEVYNTLVVHHSAFLEENDRATLHEIQDLHRGRNGWADVAYHYLIGRDGTIYEGRDVGVRGAHVEGANTGTVGVCLLGNYAVDTPPMRQIEGAITLMVWLADWLQLTHIATHRDFNGDITECPGDNLAAYMPRFAAATNLTIGTEGYVPPS